MSRESEAVSESDIAIVGRAGRFAGSPDVDALWTNLRDGIECIARYTDEELLEAGVDAGLLSNPKYVKCGGHLDDVALFDAGFFGFGPKDAAILDPQHRHFYESAWTALEDAGHTPAGFDGAIGVFAGCGMNSYFMYNLLTNQDVLESTGAFLLRHTGNDRDFLSTTLSYKLNLTGPSVAIQTACSTSLVAIHFAIQSLLSGESDMVLAGGVTIEVPHRHGYLYREGEVLTPDGRCCSFDARGTGTILTSGVGVLALRRAEDAIADGDVIHAIIKGSAVNNDGSQKVGYLAPSVDGQAAVISEALAVADVEADSISYIETHGTGTAVGDPIEVAALTEAYRHTTDRTQFCAIGSNKPNIGHTDTAAGVISVLKVMEAMKHKQLPPSINYDRANPLIDFESSPFYVNDTLRDWVPESGPRRAGVSSLGVGGTNAHVILEEPPEIAPSDPSEGWQVLTVSAKSGAALDGNTDRLASFLGAHPETNLADAAHTLQFGRDDFEHRRVIVARSCEEAAQALEERDPKRVFSARAKDGQPSVIFMFPGGGAQYPNMGYELYQTEPVYRAAMDECFAAVAPLLDSDLKALMYRGDEVSEEDVLEIRRASRLLPSTLATEYALAKLWMHWGVEPAAMTGHSLGEYAAACLAGVMSIRDALEMVITRGLLMEGLDVPSGMLNVPLSESEVLARLPEELDLAVINGPSLCVVAGPLDAIESFDQKLREEDVECRLLRVPNAGHCRLLDPILDDFRAMVERIELHPPERPYVSNLTGTWIRAEDATDPDYWVRHLREGVRFSDGLATLLENEDRVLIEVGPGQTLSSLARQQENKARVSIASLRHPEDTTPDAQFVRTAFGRLWSAGFAVDWTKLRKEGERRLRITLPTYAFDRQRYWVEPGRSLAVAGVDAAGEIQRLDDFSEWFRRPVWRPAPMTEGDPAEDKPGWLVFADSSGVSARIIHQLEEAGHPVTVVREGDAFYKLGDREYALAPEAGPEGYADLVRELAETEQLPDRIAHLWLLTTDETARPGSNFFHRNEERGFYSLLFLAQALGAEDVSHDIHLAVVANGMQRVADEALPYPEKSLVLGPVGVIPQEFPHVSCQSIDVVLPIDEESGLGERAAVLDDLADRLLSDIHPSQADGHLAYRGDKRWLQGIDHVRAEDLAGSQPRVKEGGTYVVTGGLGGLGLLVAEHLAKTARAKLVLVGRTALPEREEWDEWLSTHGSTDPTSAKLRQLKAMEALGSEVLVAAADSADLSGMRRVLDAARDRFGGIDGVFHVAGAVDDGPIQAKTEASIERVFASKVHGTLVLDRLLDDYDPDLFVLFSSSSSVLAPAGQVDYAAASIFVNAFAQSRRGRSGRHTVTVDWGVWRDVGSAVDTYDRLGSGGDAGRPAVHPLLDRRITDTADEIVFSTQYEGAAHWILDDHRSRAGEALIPGTGYLELARAAVCEVQNTEAIELSNVFFVAPLMVGEDEVVEQRVSLRRDDGGYEFEIESRLEGGTDWQLHSQGVARPIEGLASERIDIAEIASRCDEDVQVASDDGFLETLHESQLRFGPRWRVIRGMRFGSGEAVAQLELSQAFADDLSSYPLHPAVLDLATGFATPLIEGYRGDSLWAPMSYKRVVIHAPLTRKIVSHVRSAKPNHVDSEIATFDVTVTDEAGNVLVTVEEFALRKLSEDKSFAAKRASGAAGQAAVGGSDGRLSAAERAFQRSYELGIRPEEGIEALDRILSGGDLSQVFVSSMDLPDLIERYRAVGEEDDSTGAHFARPELDSTFVEPRDAVEETLASIWQELLGVDKVGIHDDFFELGGHSLIAVRLFAKIKKTWDLDYAISLLFQAPTIETCAEMIRSDLGIELGESQAKAAPSRPRHRFLVPLQVGDPDRPPFFLVAGMFGNVLNLRHLAMHLGDDQTVYAIQARGLMGEDEPHRRFEEMGRDYLEEIRTVQPEGPYYLGGFSGGGITAFEMAQQLVAGGEKVGFLTMLDSMPAEDLRPTTKQKLSVHRQKLQRQGPAYLVSWLRNQIKWRLEQRVKRDDAQLHETSPAEFRSKQIELAFREALVHYRTGVYPGKAVLFRPSHDGHYPIGDGYYFVESNRTVVNHHNRFGPHIAGGLEVNVVTGDHDAMVLEPHVRRLAATLRQCLDDAIVEQAAELAKSEGSA